MLSWANCKYSFRSLAKTPTFSLSVILTLTLAIGANTVMFSILSATIWRTFPYSRPDSVVTLWESNPSEGADQFPVAPANFRDWKAGADAFERMSLYSFGTSALATQDDTVRIDIGRVDGDFFALFGTRPSYGRLLTPQDLGAGQSHVAVISDDLWRTRFGASPNVLGRPLMIDLEQYTIVGVLPSDFEFIRPTQAWIPLNLGANADSREARPYRALGLLKHSGDLGHAGIQLNTIAERLEKDYPATNRNWRVKLIPIREYLTKDVRLQLLTLFGAVGFVLLIGCANVANLLLTRMAARRKELAIRVALGSSRSAIVAQSMIDSIILSGISGAAGVLLSVAGFRTITALIAGSGFPLRSTIDWRLFLFAAAASLAAGIAFGVGPALHAAGVPPDAVLKEGGKGGDGNIFVRGRLRVALTIAEVSISMILLLGAGLLIKSFWLLQRVSPGFRTENLLTARVSLSLKRYPGPDKRAQFFNDFLDRARSLPGAESVAAVTSLPFSGSEMTFNFSAEGSDTGHSATGAARYHAASPGYFQTIGISLLEGRDFGPSDTMNSLPVVIVNQTLARQFFPSGRVLGKHLRIAYGEPQPREIIGIINDVKHRSLNEAVAPEAYVPYKQNPWPFMTLVLRSNVNPVALVPDLRAEVREIDPTQPLDQVHTMEALLAGSVGRPKMYAILAGAFGLLALVLASMGIYSVMAFAVSTRTYEIGVRISLGASPAVILRQFLWEGLRHALVGIAIGLAGSLLLMRLIANMLYHVAPLDPIVALSGLTVLVAAAVLACYIPAHRAMKIDPLAAIRYE